MLIDGKQLRDGTIAAAKLASAFLATILRADGSVTWTGTVNAGSQRITSLGAPLLDTDAARLADIYAIPWKDKCLCATTGNHALSGLAAIDGVTPVATNRILVRANTAGAENGIYNAAVGAWTRAADADSAAEVRGFHVHVEQGTLYANHDFAQTADSVTLGTTPLTIVDLGIGTQAAFDVSSNKGMTASVTTTDFQVACATALVTTPAQDAYVRISVNGLGATLGDGVKTKDCYFSSDGGTTAKTIANIAAGDLCYWVGTVALYQLAATDIIDFEYAA
jgi:hypothetical protein